MKRALRLALVFSLLLGAVGCGPSEREVANDATTQPADSSERDRNMGVMGNIGVGMVSGLAMNAIGMGLAAIPGMPKEISALFGGGGSDNTAVLEAINKLSEQIAALDAKVEEVKGIVKGVDAKVEDLAGAVQLLAESECEGQKFQRQSELSPLLDLVNKSSVDLFGERGIARAILDKMHTGKIEPAAMTLDSDVENVLRNSYDILSKSQTFYTAFETLSRSLLGNESQGSGLLAHMMKCTALNKRFLTSADTAVWKAYADTFVILGIKVLQLKAFVESFRAYSAKGKISLLELNKESLRFEQLSRGLLFMVQNQIPSGQVFDTQTRKMWTVGASNRRAVDAFKVCLATGGGVSNVVPTPGASLNPDAKTTLKNCVTNQQLDTDGEQGQWRVPQINELAMDSALSGVANPSWAPSGTVGLIDGWNKSVCGSTRNMRCDTPAAYLNAMGAGILSSIANDGLAYVWSNTSLAAARGPRDRAANDIMRENDLAMSGPNGHQNVNDYHYNGGWINGSAFMQKFSKACEQEFNTDPKNAQRYNECRSNFNSDEMGPRCRAIIAGNPMPFSMASIQVLNIGPSRSPMSGNTSAVNANYMSLSAGKIGTFIGAKSYFSQYFACGTLHKDCDWLGSCDKWETKDFESLLPQYADTLLVRDLMPGENYIFTDAAGSSVKSWTLRRQFEAPLVRVSSLSSGNVQMTIGESSVGGSVDARCMVDPATTPKRFDEFPTTSSDCSFALPFRLKPGPHTVFAVAKDRGNGATTDILKTDLTVGGTPPPAAESVTVAVQSRGVQFTLASMNTDYDYYGEVQAIGETQAPIRCKIDPTSKTCLVGSLVNNKRYRTKVVTTYGVLATDSTPGESVPFGPPPTPSAVVSKRVNNGVELTLSVAQATTIPTPVSSFEIWNGSSKMKTCAASGDSTSCALTNLDNGQSYDLVVKAVNDFGITPSAAPISVRSLAPPGAPEAVIVAGSSGMIDVAWDKETTGGPASSYRATAYVAGGAAAGSCNAQGVTTNSTLVTPPPTQCTIKVADGELTYTIKVVAMNDGGSSSDAVAAKTIRPQFVPGVPTVSASARDGRLSVAVAVAGGGSVDSVDVTSKPAGLSCKILSPATECEVTGFERNKTYQFEAVANNNTGPSAKSQLSNPIYVYNAPRVPSIKSVETGKSRLTVEMNPSLTEVVDGWNVSDSSGTARCTIVVPATTCDLSGLTNGSKYNVVVVAFNNGGSSVSLTSATSYTPIAEPNPPRAPVVDLGIESATVSVTSTDSSITSYVIREKDDAGLTCTVAVSSPASAGSCTINGLVPGFGYSFGVTAINKIGPSLPSAWSATVFPQTKPLAPLDAILTSNLAGITVDVIGDPDSSPAKKYYVTASPGNLSCIAVGPAGNGQSKCSLNGASRGRNYTISIVAENSGGRSEAFTQFYYLIAPPTAPAGMTAEVSPSGIVVGFDSSNMNIDSVGVRVTALPGGVACDITLPSTTCLLAVDTSKSYTLSAVGLSETGETSAKVVQQSAPKFALVVQSDDVTATNSGISGSKLTDSSGTTTSTAMSNNTQTNSVSTLQNAPEPEQVATAPAGGLAAKLSVPLVVDMLKRSSLSKVATSKYSAKIKPVSKKVCQLNGEKIVKLSSGQCVIELSYVVTKTSKKGSKVVTSTSKAKKIVRLEVK